jgi:choline monooxygenase
MNSETERDIAAQLDAARAAGGQVHGLTGLGEDPVAAENYQEAARYRTEIERIFWRSWIPVARVDEITEPGRWLLRRVERAEIVVTRALDGTLRAFHNTCRHRGSAVVSADGCGKRLVCPYHAWSYELNGELASVPDPLAYPRDFDLASIGLGRVHVATGWGWVWVNLREDPPSLEAFLGPHLLDELDNWQLERAEHKGRIERKGAYAWQVGVEAFLEPYHVPNIHRRSVNPVVQVKHTAMAWWGDHSRMVIELRDPRLYEPEGVLGRLAAAADVSILPALNGLQRRTNFVYFVWPSTIFNLLPNHITVISLLPEGTAQCRMVLEVLGAPTTTDAQRTFWERLVAGYEGLLDEDDIACAAVQRGLSGPYRPPHVYCQYDRRIRHFRGRREAWLSAR